MRDRAVLMAVVLVCLTNLGALGVGALNRASVETSATLTERELRLSHPAKSVTLLRIMWVQPSDWGFGAEQAARAGFDTSVPASAHDARTHYRRQLDRDAYVALEYDGPAWISYRDAMLKADSPGTALLAPPDAQRQRVERQRASETHSRLVAVGVDADPARLRAEYPEASRYLIAHARVGVDVGRDSHSQPLVVARVIELKPSELNVPRPFSDRLRDLTRDHTDARASQLFSSPRYVVDVKYGRFHQPWIADLRPHR